MATRILQASAPPSSRVRVDEAALQRCFDALDALDGFNAPPGELSFAFLSDGELARLHADFLEDPTPTDVITFPGDPEMDFAGEICVSADRARAEAPRHGWSPAEELALYLVHGWLHLAGYDDIDEADRTAMRQAEQTCFAALRQANALPEFTFAE